MREMVARALWRLRLANPIVHLCLSSLVMSALAAVVVTVYGDWSPVIQFLADTVDVVHAALVRWLS
jgi:hypothetical protein